MNLIKFTNMRYHAYLYYDKNLIDHGYNICLQLDRISLPNTLFQAVPSEDRRDLGAPQPIPLSTHIVYPCMYHERSAEIAHIYNAYVCQLIKSISLILSTGFCLYTMRPRINCCPIKSMYSCIIKKRPPVRPICRL